MKKLTILLALSIVCLIVATSIAQGQEKQKIKGSKTTLQCEVSFSSVINEGPDPFFDLFQDEVESFVENNYFWQGCIKNTLASGKDVKITYIAYTNSPKPTKTELARALKSADKFKEELEDYIENVEEDEIGYIKPEKYILIQAPIQITSNKKLAKSLKKINKNYNATITPKILIDIDIQQATKKEGSIEVSIIN